jgi:Na+-driven multidrug efflux pump
MFQGLGNTKPAMLSTAIRLTVFVPVAIWISKQPGFHLEQLWVVSVVTVWFQALVSYLLLRHQFNRRLVDTPPRPTGAPVGEPAVAEGHG